MGGRLRRVVVLGLLALLPALEGCEKLDPDPEERLLIEVAVRAYLERLAEAYSALDVGKLEGTATANEITAVQQQLRTLGSSGDRVHAMLLQVDVTAIQMFRVVNASVETTEVWDVTRYDVYTGREKGRNTASVQRALLQLRRVKGAWLVSARAVVERPPTPAPVPESDP